MRGASIIAGIIAFFLGLWVGCSVSESKTEYISVSETVTDTIVEYDTIDNFDTIQINVDKFTTVYVPEYLPVVIENTIYDDGVVPNGQPSYRLYTQFFSGLGYNGTFTALTDGFLKDAEIDLNVLTVNSKVEINSSITKTVFSKDRNLINTGFGGGFVNGDFITLTESSFLRQVNKDTRKIKIYLGGGIKTDFNNNNIITINSAILF